MREQIDWKRIEKEFKLTPLKMAQLAGVSRGMYYLVRNGTRNFSEGALFRFRFNLARRINTQNKSLLDDAFRLVAQCGSKE